MFSDMTFKGSTYTSAATVAGTTSLADIQRALELIKAMPPEPIGEWMRGHGHPPETWAVVLPAQLKQEAATPAFWPAYVVFSEHITAPVFVLKRPTLNPLTIEDFKA